MKKLTSFERDVVFSSIVSQEDDHSLPYDAADLLSVIFPGRRFVAEGDLAAARDKLVALGVFARKTSPRRVWLEIQPDYRHTQGDIQTSFADDTPEPQQQEMSLLLALPNVHATRKGNQSRVESEQSRASESRAPTRLDAETRTLSRGKDSAESPKKCFALDEDAFPDDERFHDLARTLGLVEMTRCGRLWKKRWAENPRALCNALEDYRLKPPADRPKNAAAYITAAYTGECARAGTA